MAKSPKYERLFWWAQPAPGHALRRGRVNNPAKVRDSIHLLRDGAAFSFIQGGLTLKYGGIILNFNPEMYDARHGKSPLLARQDLLVSVTRPALNDNLEDDPRPIGRSQSKFEIEIYNALRRTFFEYVNRDAIVLSR